jgi:putative nucleotidyltransferase with HDIG domain
MKDPKAYLFLAKLSSHDPYTLQHSVGAAVNAIILARKIGITSEKELNEVGMGGLFHDLGKVKVRPEIINKAGPLDEQEWEEMRQHPEAGFELLKGNPDVPDRSKRAVLEHHEDKTGGGYPYKRPYREIDLHSKIVGIADIFNALTTKRSYADARTPYQAFELMGDKMRHKIDEDLFAALVLVYGGKLNPI